MQFLVTVNIAPNALFIDQKEFNTQDAADMKPYLKNHISNAVAGAWKNGAMVKTYKVVSFNPK